MVRTFSRSGATWSSLRSIAAMLSLRGRLWMTMIETIPQIKKANTIRLRPTSARFSRQTTQRRLIFIKWRPLLSQVVKRIRGMMNRMMTLMKELFKLALPRKIKSVKLMRRKAHNRRSLNIQPREKKVLMMCLKLL